MPGSKVLESSSPLSLFSGKLKSVLGWIPLFTLIIIFVFSFPGCGNTLLVREERLGQLPGIAWETNALYESRKNTGAFNAGVLQANITGTIDTGSFNISIGQVENSHYSITGLPEGLFAHLFILSSNEINIRITGEAVNHRAEKQTFTITIGDEVFTEARGMEKTYTFDLWLASWETGFRAVRLVPNIDVIYEHPDDVGTFLLDDSRAYTNEIAFLLEGGFFNSRFDIRNSIVFSGVPEGLVPAFIYNAEGNNSNVFRVYFLNEAVSHDRADNTSLTVRLSQNAVTPTSNFIYGPLPEENEIPPTTLDFRFGEYIVLANLPSLQVSTNHLYENVVNDGSFLGSIDIFVPEEASFRFKATADLGKERDIILSDGLPSGLDYTLSQRWGGRGLVIEIQGGNPDHSMRVDESSFQINSSAFSRTFVYGQETHVNSAQKSFPLNFVYGHRSSPWSPRHDLTILVDPAGTRLWLIGGRSGGVYHNDVWTSVDGRLWELLTPDADWGVSSRANFSTVFFQNRIWVMGGRDDRQYYADVVWSKNGRDWNQVTPYGDWSSRYSAHCVFFKNQLWLLGGKASTAQIWKNDIWSSSDGTNWAQVETSSVWEYRGMPPPVIHDRKLWIIGGYRDNARYTDVWSSSDGSDWIRVSSSNPLLTRDEYQVEAFDNKLWIIGGVDMEFKNDVWWSWDGATWIKATSDSPWEGRSSHAVYVFKNRLRIAGGKTTSTNLNDMWESADGEIWTKTHFFTYPEI